MNRPLVDRIAAAVLYEGYLLYPYRPSVKNRQRWTFGGLLPEAYCVARECGDLSTMQAECIVRRPPNAEDASPTIDIAVKFLQLIHRTDASQRQSEWQEAIEREVRLQGLALDLLITTPTRHHFSFPHDLRTEPPITREQHALKGSIEVSARATEIADCIKLTIRVNNDTPLDSPADRTRDEAMLYSFASTHMVLVAGGEASFVSMTDPSAEYRRAVEACHNIGAWPILVGEPGESDTLLCSPIILSDYPTLAPESPGDLFDGCEIDEILTLRIMALTDDEKREMRATDDHAAALLQRTEALTREQLMSLHGTVRPIQPAEAPASRGGDA